MYTENTCVEDEDIELSEDIDAEPKANLNWSVSPSGDEMVQVEELLQILVRVLIDGVKCTENFIGRLIQPCKMRSRPAYEYYVEDFTREAPEPLRNNKVDQRVAKLFSLKKDRRTEPGHPARAYGMMNPPPEVIHLPCFSAICIVTSTCP